MTTSEQVINDNFQQIKYELSLTSGGSGSSITDFSFNTSTGSFYNLFANHYLEQYGKLINTNMTQGLVIIQFPKSFRNTLYFFNITNIEWVERGILLNPVYTKSVNQIQFSLPSKDHIAAIEWEAKGFQESIDDN